MTTMATVASPVGSLRDYVALTKPRITTLVLVTTAGGLALAPGSMALVTALVAIVGTTLVVAAANALNCWLERDIDAKMTRTASRPLPRRRLDPRAALMFGWALAAISIPLLTFGVNALTGSLAALALLLYVGVYTPLKQQSPHALLIGAVPGALPPVIGWTAATGSVDPPAVVLFAILFLWQVPHFIAIALFRAAEYERAGIRVLPLIVGARWARIHAFVYAAALIPVSLLLLAYGIGGRLYATLATLLGLGFLALTATGLDPARGDRWARRVFIGSLIYLTALFAALMLDA